MRTGREGVGLTFSCRRHFFVGVETSSYDSGFDVVLPGAGGVTPVATVTTGENSSATGEEVFGGNSGLDFGAAGDAESVGDCFDGSEGPTGTTVWLVSYFLDGFAVGVGFSEVVVFGKV